MSGGCVKREVFRARGFIHTGEFIVQACEVGLAVVAVISFVVFGHQCLVLWRAGLDGGLLEERFPSQRRTIRCESEFMKVGKKQCGT